MHPPYLTDYGLAPWFTFAIMALIVLYPLGRILARMGLSPLLAIVALVPFVNVIALWIVAFIAWPKCSSEPS